MSIKIDIGIKKPKYCPYYKNGLCISPKLNTPTDAVTSPSRCYDENMYKTCKYYEEKDQKETEEKGLTKYIPKTSILNFYPAVNLLDEAIQPQCEYFRLYQFEKRYVARCEILDRILTKGQVNLCLKYANKCPFRKEKV